MTSTKKYTNEIIALHGISDIFKLCHIPFLVYKDVYGALALEGSSGTGKTSILQRIGILNKAATGEDFGIFSADKARYEDFIGCPIPNQETKEMDMYPMKHAVATKALLLIDEINRANYGNQEKWMSLLSSRKIDGFDVACKYIYVAMNPVMSEENDIYEGVQPLDKALGERIYGLIRMRPFYEMDEMDQKAAMLASFNQTSWEPTDKDIEAHTKFIKDCRAEYEEGKEKFTTNICEYIYLIGKLLKEETKKSTTIEARRAQYILSNILATHALNKVYIGNLELETSSIEALELSFPGRLWEQAVPLTALKQAHKECKKVLIKATKLIKRTVTSSSDLFNRIKNIRSVVEQNPTKEALTKVINDNVPDIEAAPLDHYLYAIAAVKGLTTKDKSKLVIKAQEFDRLLKITEKVKEHEEFKRAKTAGEAHIKSKQFPKDYKYPSYIELSLTGAQADSLLLAYHGLLDFDSGWFVQTIVEMTETDIANGRELIDLAGMLETLASLFKNISMKLENKNVEWLDYETSL